MKIILSAFIYLFSSMMLIAQTKSIEVKDAQTKETLTGVYAIDQNNNKNYHITNNQILQLKIGETYKISHIGYSFKILRVETTTPDILYLEAEKYRASRSFGHR